MNNNNNSKKHSICLVKVILSVTAVVISLIALPLASPEFTPGAYGFAVSNFAVALTNSDFRRRQKGRCFLKIAVSICLLFTLLVILWLVPQIKSSSIGLLCVAAALLSMIPALPHLARRS